MKNLLLSALILFSALSTTTAKAEQSNYQQYQGKAPVALTYLGTGWKTQNGNCEWFSIAFVSVAGVGGGTAAAVGWWGAASATVATAAGVAVVGAVAGFAVYCTDSHKTKETTLEAKLKAIISKKSEDRVSITLESKSAKRCGGFNLKLIGEDDGFGNYELFANKEAYLENKPMGSMTEAGSKVLINISEPMTIITKGKKGFDCRWDLANGLNAELN